MKGPNPALHLPSIDKVLGESLNGSTLRAEQWLLLRRAEAPQASNASSYHTALLVPYVMVEWHFIQDNDTKTPDTNDTELLL